MKHNWNLKDKNLKKVTLSEVDFIFKQAEKHLDRVIDGSNKVVTRQTIVLSLCVGIITTLFGFLLNSGIDFNNIKFQENFSIYIAIGYSWIVLFISAINIAGKKYMDAGTEPNGLLHDHYYEVVKVNRQDSRLKYMKLQELEEYQKRISYNKNVNKFRWKVYHITQFAILLLPVLIVIIEYIRMQC